MQILTALKGGNAIGDPLQIVIERIAQFLSYLADAALDFLPDFVECGHCTATGLWRRRCIVARCCRDPAGELIEGAVNITKVRCRLRRGLWLRLDRLTGIMGRLATC